MQHGNAIVIIAGMVGCLIGMLTGIVLGLVVGGSKAADKGPSKKPKRPPRPPATWTVRTTERFLEPKPKKREQTRFMITDIPVGPGPRFIPTGVR